MPLQLLKMISDEASTIHGETFSYILCPSARGQVATLSWARYACHIAFDQCLSVPRHNRLYGVVGPLKLLCYNINQHTGNEPYRYLTLTV